MAMMKCPECGRDISDTASVCPGCGAPVRKPGCTVRFERHKAILFGAAVDGTIYIDGQRAGSASNGSSFEVFLPYGEHSVEFASSNSLQLASKRTNAQTLDVPVGAKKVIVTVKVKNDVTSVVGGAAKLGIADVEVIR